MAEAEGAAPPQDLVDQIDLLLSPLSKEDMIARLVARELGRLNLGHRADLNDRGPKKKGFKKDGQGFKGGTSAGGFKKPFKKGGYKKDGYQKDGYQKGKPGGYKKKPVWDDDGFAAGGGDWAPREGNGGYRKSMSGGAKKGGYKKGKPGGFKKGPGGPNKGGYKKRW